MVYLYTGSRVTCTRPLLILAMLTECAVEMVCELVQARLDKFLHGGLLVDGAVHSVVDRSP